MKRLFPLLFLLAAVAPAQEKKEELVEYSAEEIDNLLNTFHSTYKKKSSPEEDAVSALANLKQAYRYLDSKGEQATKDEQKLQKKIIKLIAKGLFAKRRELVNLECARVLGELGAEAANGDLRKWMERVLDEKSVNPQFVEYGFKSLAWIGSKDSRTRDLIIDYATKGKHTDIGVASQALRAVYQYRELDAKTREEWFKKSLGYLLGLWSKMKGGEAKQRGTYEQRYNAVKDEGLKALEELAGDGSKFANPVEANEWRNKNKKKKWEPYVGPRFRGEKKAEEKS